MFVGHVVILVYIVKDAIVSLVQLFYMEIIILLTAIIQGFAISLGVGASTLAIVNFFVAIADGKIDDTERKMMGIVYVVLRVAMSFILLTTLFLVGVAFAEQTLGSYQLVQLIVVAVLFINAILMTKHLMPSTFGPALQAGSWYTLSVVTTLATLGIGGYSLAIFGLAYVTWLVLAVAIVNGVMAILRAKRKG